jgi:hypothetical protein
MAARVTGMALTWSVRVFHAMIMPVGFYWSGPTGPGIMPGSAKSDFAEVLRGG